MKRRKNKRKAVKERDQRLGKITQAKKKKILRQANTSKQDKNNN